MTSERQRRLCQYLNNLTVEQSDAESFIEINQGTIESRIESTALAKSDQERDTCLSAHRKLMTGDKLTPQEQFLFEAIVLPTERPALLVRDDSYERPPDPWGNLDRPEMRSRLEMAIRSVGRVEIIGSNSAPYAGTAFVVGPGLLMTNCHVAELFSQGVGCHVRFLSGMGSAIDFVREKGRSAPSVHPVAKVVMCHPYWDMALLRVESLVVKPLQLLPKHPDDCRQRKIAVIGYPATDPRNDPFVQRRVFGNDSGVKRFQPGFAVGSSEFQANSRTPSTKRETLEHDASTLGGNSGSAVIDVETGKVIGLHFAGRYEVANYAVPAFELARDGRVRDAGVQFADGTAEDPNPWQSQWDNTELTANVPPPQPKPARRHDSSNAGQIVIDIPVHISIRVEKALKKDEES